MTSKRLTPIKSIRKYCLACSGDSWMEVKLCVIPDCPLYAYRLGKNPYIKRGGSGDGLKRYREKLISSIGEKSQGKDIKPDQCNSPP